MSDLWWLILKIPWNRNCDSTISCLWWSHWLQSNYSLRILLIKLTSNCAAVMLKCAPVKALTLWLQTTKRTFRRFLEPVVLSKILLVPRAQISPLQPNGLHTSWHLAGSGFSQLGRCAIFVVHDFRIFVYNAPAELLNVAMLCWCVVVVPSGTPCNVPCQSVDQWRKKSCL